MRPVVMTTLMALMPAVLSTGIGSKPSKPLAIVVIDGLLTGTVLALFILPLLFERTYRAEHTHYVDDLPTTRELATH